jgi:ribosomal protein S18 acetylase RimI-like enzyme
VARQALSGNRQILEPCGADTSTYNFITQANKVLRKGTIPGRGEAQGGTVVQYRMFRNVDPPQLVEIWNEAFTGRGAVILRNSSPLERFVFAKPIFDPAGLMVADDDGHCVGFAHAAMVQGDPQGVGVTCVIGVKPAFRRRGIGSELLRRCERYLVERGAKTLYAGPHWPFNPFYLGLYGGCDSPGFLTSDAAAEPFFLRRQYQITLKTLVMQRRLDQPVKIIDPRFAPHRQHFQVRACSPRSLHGFWKECVFGYLDPLELQLEDKQTGAVAARSLVWEMDLFGQRWNRPAIGIMGFEVEAKLRRLGVGKYLLSQLMRQVQEQYFEIAEAHLREDNQPAIQFVKSLAFEHVDTGQVFMRTAA